MSSKELEKLVNEHTKQEQKEMFLKLRIQGYTFAEISKRLGKSKQTMINWSKEPDIKEAIDEARSIRYQSILKEYQQDREAKIRFYGKIMLKLMEALDKKEFSDVSPDKVLKLMFECGKSLTKAVPKYEFKDEPDILGLGSEQRSFTFNPED